MKKFLAIYNSPAEAKAAFASLSPEQMQEGMKPWMEWNQRSGDAIVDLGAPVMPGNTKDSAGNWSSTPGDAGGYSIVQAESLEAAKALFENHPHLAHHPASTVDLYECANM